MSTALVPVPPAVIERFQGNGRLTVRQRKRWLELLLSFEMKNAYDVFDADNFGIDLEGVPDPAHRALLFAATVLIDVVHFERAKG